MAASARPIAPAASLTSSGGTVVTVRTTINGQPIVAEVEPRTLLVHFLREVVGLTGTHIGCDTTNCGACTVHLDGTPVKSCTVLAVQTDGREVRTVEGLEVGGKLSPVQEAFYECHGLQCGFCTPGMMMTATALLARNPNPTEAEVRDAIRGNRCRCTGYVNIVKAIQLAGQKMQAAPAPSGGKA